MALYLISALTAFVFLLPQVAEILDFRLPLSGFLSVPATGLDYMAVLFHELGHAAALWIFGYPALPSLDFANGGGMTYDFERLEALLAAVYGLAVMGAAYFYRQGSGTLAGAIGGAALLHLMIAFNAGHEVLALYMGHGAEILIGAFCILRGIIGHVEYGSAEKWLNMIFGVYVLGRNAVMSLGLALDDISRMAYENQKGGHGFGDFSRIADILGWKVEAVAALSLALLCAALAFAIFSGWREKRFLQQG